MGYQYGGTKPTYKITPDGARRELKPCGTEAAYKRHLRERTIPCQPCTIAHAANVREWWQRRKGAAA